MSDAALLFATTNEGKAREIRRFGRPQVVFHREVASRFSHQPHRVGTPVSAGLLNLYALQLTVFRHLVYGYLAGQEAGLLTQALTAAGFPCGSQLLTSVAERFCSLYPGTPQLAEPAVAPGDWLAADDPTASRQQAMAVELMLLALGAENRALDPFRELIDDTELALAFPEMRPFVGKCKFGLDCRHEEEPGCAIRKAVIEGRISPRRYHRFLALKAGN